MNIMAMKRILQGFLFLISNQTTKKDRRTTIYGGKKETIRFSKLMVVGLPTNKHVKYVYIKPI